MGDSEGKVVSFLTLSLTLILSLRRVRDNTFEVFFALVRAGLWGKVGANLNVDLNLNEMAEWGKVYQLAQEQSVQGIALHGIERFKRQNDKLNIPQVFLLQWIGEVQLIEQRNREMNVFVADLFEKLHNQGVEAFLVKGQGLAQCYEKPLWRTSGDVDILLSNDDYLKAKEFLMPLGVLTEPEETAKKHLAIDIEGWPIELHGTLHCGLSRSVDKLLDKVQTDTFEGKMSDGRDKNVRVWKNGEKIIPLLSAENDVFYVFTHILQHFYKGGIGLRQICDWCRLLWTFKDSLNHGVLESRIREAGLMSQWKAFGAFAVEYLGMPVEAMPFLNVRGKKVDGRCEIEVNLRKKADKICDFILEVGNFGQNRDNSYFQKHSYFVQKCISAWRRVKDLYRHAAIFPINSVRFFFGIMYNGIVSAIRGE